MRLLRGRKAQKRAGDYDCWRADLEMGSTAGETAAAGKGGAAAETAKEKKSLVQEARAFFTDPKVLKHVSPLIYLTCATLALFIHVDFLSVVATQVAPVGYIYNDSLLLYP